MKLHKSILSRPTKFLFGRAFVIILLILNLFFPFGLVNPTANAVSNTLVISQVYGGGGNTGATYRNDFIEIFNRGITTVDVSGWSVQYGGATLTTWASTPLTGSIAPGHYYLIQEDMGAGGTQNLPTPEATGSIVMSATAGKVALVNSTTLCSGNDCAGASRIDFIGYGSSANASEGSPAPAPGNTTADLRASSGCTDTDANNSDFAAGTPNPRNSASATNGCGNNLPPTITVPANPITTVAQNAAPFNVSLSGNDDGGVYNWSATVGTGITSLNVNSGQGTATITYQVTLQTGFTGTANFTANLTDNVNTPVTQTVNILVNLTGNAPPTITAPANPITSKAKNAASFNVSLSGNDAEGVYNWSVTVGSGVNSVIIGSGQGTANIIYAVTLTTGFVGTASFTATLSDNVNSPVNQTVNILVYTPIAEIQGASRVITITGAVSSEGVVTGKKSNGFFMQDPLGDANNATSEGIFVFTSSAPTVIIGNRVRVTGAAQDFNDLSEISATTPVNIVSLGLGAVISPVIITVDPNRSGPNIRKIPGVVYDSSTNGGYDPAKSAVDFLESLEGMLVEIDGPLKVVGPTTTTGEFVVVPDNGAGITFNSRGGVTIGAGDFNPERFTIDNSLAGPSPKLSVGDKINSNITGPLDYVSSNFVIQTLAVISAGSIDTTGQVQPETLAAITNPNHLRIASFNLENFSATATNADAKFNKLASEIVTNLKLPDIITLIEIQDDSGSTNDGVVTADQNLNLLRDKISALSSGVTYSYRYVNPVDNQDGGQPGGNIRQVFFFRTDRGLTFADRPAPNSSTANAVQNNGSLLYNPGRIDPTSSAFLDSRKPLTGEFVFNNKRFVVIGNHLNSKIGDGALYGPVQPPVLSTETKRNQQATIIRNFINQIQVVDPNARIIVAGDMNDFEFASPLNILKTGPTTTQNLTDVVDNIPLSADRYSYVFQGNSQSIDHLLYSQSMANTFVEADMVHVNSDFYEDPNYVVRGSDHEPVTAVFNITPCLLPYVVTSNTDDGLGTTCGTLSYAISTAKTDANDVTITFSNVISVGVQAQLPQVQNNYSKAITIDGGCTTDINGRGIPGVILAGTAISQPNTAVGLRLNGKVTVNGLKVVDFTGGFSVELSGTNNTLTCNWIGTGDGVAALANKGGVQINIGSANNILGAAGQPAKGNLISGNSGAGLLVKGGPGNIAYNTWIGWQKDGIGKLKNNGPAVSVVAGGNLQFGPGNRINQG